MKLRMHLYRDFPPVHDDLFIVFVLLFAFSAIAALLLRLYL